jgi:soluble lytic murein transglycosylase-like protein
MLALKLFVPFPTDLSLNICMRFCSILLFVLPAFAADVTSVVRADARTGRLVRTVPMLKAASTPEDVSTLIAMIDRQAEAAGVESALVHSVIRAESNYNANAVSPKGALGIMQLIPSTAKRFGVTNVFDPEDNVGGGVRYLKFLLDYYKGDYPRAIAAYNAGEGAVDKFKGIPPYPETRNYVWQVAQNLKEVRQARPAVPTAPLTATHTAEASHPIQVTTGADGRTYFSTP